MNPSSLAIGEAAKVCGVTPSYLRRFDAELAPERVGSIRIYQRDAVDTLAGKIAARRATRAARHKEVQK